MNDDVITFRESFLEEVAISAEANNDLTSSCFVNVFVENYLSDIGIINDFTLAQYKRPFKAGRKNARIDGFSENIFDNTVSVVISDFYNEESPINLTKTDATQVLKECISFLEESINGNLKLEIDKSDPAYILVDMLYQGRKKDSIRKIKVILISDKTRSNALKSMDSISIDGIVVDFAIWTIDRLFENIKDDGETRDIIFSDYGCESVNCLCVEAGEYPGYLCAMPGNLLANLYEKLDSELLEGNIRSFLSTKVAVNSGIRRTIVNEPDRFFIYNNGISATASEVHTKEINGQIYLTGIVDFQIVNGGQTTASLYNSRYKDKSDLSSIFVPMKLTVVEKEQAKNVIPLIAEYANTQNKVDAADFFANHEFCIKMERYSRSCSVEPQDGSQYDTYWFFERAKGQYSQAQIGKTSAQIKEFKLKYPKTQFFKKTDLAKYRNSWACLPDVVSKGAQTNFQKFAEEIKKNYDDKADEYNEKYFIESVALGILFRNVEALVSVQDWYQQGYRANIVTYSIALFSKLMKDQFPDFEIDFMQIWKKQKIPSVIMNEFVSITKIVNDSISDPTRDTVNISQWCKRPVCWKRMQDNCFYSINPSILDACISHNEVLAQKASARKDSKEDNGILAEVEVFNYGADNWKRLREFISGKRIANPAETKALEIAIQMPYKTPNSKQSIMLLTLLDKAMDQGYKK